MPQLKVLQNTTGTLFQPILVMRIASTFRTYFNFTVCGHFHTLSTMQDNFLSEEVIQDYFIQMSDSIFGECCKDRRNRFSHFPHDLHANVQQVNDPMTERI